jgi:hypothetical protein
MDFKSKRLYKKRAKQYFVLAYGVTIAWVLFLVACLVILLQAKPLHQGHDDKASFGVMLLFMSPLIIGVACGFIGQYFVDFRSKYKAQIIEYRQRKFFTQTMNFITSGKLNEAIDVYTDLVTKSEYRRFLYPYFLCEFLHSTNEDQRKKGVERLAVVLQAYDPNEIKF